MLKMSENLAGVTLLAFGNGSPDIFASLAHHDGDTELMYSELIGAAAFVTGVIAGVIIFIRPFKVVGRNYVRDVLFFLLAVFIIDHSIHDQKYSLYEGFFTISIYVFYIIYVVCDHFWIKRKMRKLKRKSSVLSVQGRLTVTEMANIQKQAEDLEDIMEIQIKNRKNSLVILDEEILSVFEKEFTGVPNDNLFKTFIKAINPIDEEDWKNGGKISRTLIVMKVNFKKMFDRQVIKFQFYLKPPSFLRSL